jgi:tetratricopeptide (TPR) repeat protein
MKDQQKTPQCVPTETIAMLALGCEDEANDMLHISQCERCSSLLRDALEDLPRDPTAEERKLAESIPPRPVEKRNQDRGRRWPLAIAAALFVVAAAGAYRVIQQPPEPPLTMELARVYALHRSMDIRLDASPRTPLSRQRGSLEETPYRALEIKVAEALERSPNDPEALHARGRLDLFEGRETAAIEALNRAKAAGSQSLEVSTDLAAAYFQRGQRKHSAEDLNQAFELYAEFVRQHPLDTAAIFDLALTASLVRPADEAIGYWQRYLALETSRGWKAEAEERLARLRE